MAAERTPIPAGQVRTAELLAALSRVLDVCEGHPAGHAVRTSFLAVRLASAMELAERDRSDLLYASLLKDAGGAHSAADLVRVFGSSDLDQKRRAELADPASLRSVFAFHLAHLPRESIGDSLRRFHRLIASERDVGIVANEVRGEEGAAIAREVGLPSAVAAIIAMAPERARAMRYLVPQGRDVTLLARILAIAALTDLRITRRGTRAAELALRRYRRDGDARLADLLLRMGRLGLWREVDQPDVTARLLALEPVRYRRVADEAVIDRVCATFGAIADSKSVWTRGGSVRVATLAEAAGTSLRLSPQEVTDLRRAAHLRDIGKLSLPNTLLDRPGPLDEDEWKLVRAHPQLAADAIRTVSVLAGVAPLVMSHHERWDGGGYPDGRREGATPLGARIIAVAETFDALTHDRPQRRRLSADAAWATIHHGVGTQFDPLAVDAVHLATAARTRHELDLVS